MIDRFFERSISNDDVAALLQTHYETGGPGHVAALEACARLISHSFMACEVTGGARLRFPAPVMRDIGRGLVLGEYIGLLDLPLVTVHNGQIGADGRLTYMDNGVQHTATDYLKITWSENGGRHGKGALDNARALWKIASHAERVQAEELSGMVGSILPMPNEFAIGFPKKNPKLPQQPIDVVAESNPVKVISRALAGLRGGTKPMPTASQGASRNQAVPREDWKQSKLQPRVDANTVAIHGNSRDDVFRAVGVHPMMLSATLPPSREVMRLHCCFLIEPLARLIESAAAQKGMAIKIDTSPLLKYDVAGTARAFAGFIQSGLSEDEAARLVGIELEDF